MKRLMIIGFSLLLASSAWGKSDYSPEYYACNSCAYNTCIKQCKAKWETKVSTYTVQYWDPYMNKMVYPVVTVEPAEFLDLH